MCDIVVGNSVTDEVEMLIGNGDGSFSTPRLIAWPVPPRPYAVAMADVGRDQNPEVVVGNGQTQYSAGGLDFVDFDEFGTGWRENTRRGSQAAKSIVASDLDEDGVTDLVVADQDAVVIVWGEDHAPVLDVVAPQSIPENETLELQLTATDGDGDVLSYRAADLPAGATLDPSTGAFSWTPTYSQEGRHVVTFAVSDGDDDDSEVVTIESRMPTRRRN